MPNALPEALRAVPPRRTVSRAAPPAAPRTTLRAARPTATPLAGALACAFFTTFAAPAHAREGNAFTPYASLSYTYDDNLFRLPDDIDPIVISSRHQRSDVIQNAVVGLRGERYFGRQRLAFDVSSNDSRYNTYKFLNANLVNGNVVWGWQLGNKLSGEIATERYQSLTGFSEIRSSARNINTTLVNRASINYNLTPTWRLGVGANETTVRNSSIERISGNLTNEIADASITYLPVSGNRITLRTRQTRGSYPIKQLLFGVQVSNDYTQEDQELDFLWQVSGKSRVSGLVADTRRHYPDLQGRDFHGLTGRVNWEYQITGKTFLNFGWKREIGAYLDFTTNYILTDSYSLVAIHQPTAKLQLVGRVENKQRSYLGDPGIILGNTQKRVDYVNSAAFTVSYDAAWPLNLSLTASREKRSSNAAGFDYLDNSLTATVQFRW